MLSSFDKDLSSSRLAEFTLFFSGAVIAFTHLFLRANASRTAIKPSNTPWQEWRGLRLFGPSDLELLHISSPIIKQDYQSDEKISDAWISQRTGVNHASMKSVLNSSDFILPASPEKTTKKMPQWPRTEQIPSPKHRPMGSQTVSKLVNPPKAYSRQRQASYSLFPDSDDLRLPATVYTPGTISKASVSALAPTFTNPFAGTSPAATKEEFLQPPRTPWKAGHRRGSSAESMATVQIGIRFSTAPAALAASGITGNTSSHPARLGVLESVSSGRTFLSATTLSEPLDPISPHQQNNASEYAWLDIANSPSSTDSPLQTSPPTRATAESNRSEIADLERSGCIGRQGSTTRRPPPGYLSTTTSDSPSKDFGFF